jgi:hypothetical protein
MDNTTVGWVGIVTGALSSNEGRDSRPLSAPRSNQDGEEDVPLLRKENGFGAARSGRRIFVAWRSRRFEGMVSRTKSEGIFVSRSGGSMCRIGTV